VCDEYIIMLRTIISEAHMDKSTATTTILYYTILLNYIVFCYIAHEVCRAAILSSTTQFTLCVYIPSRCIVFPLIALQCTVVCKLFFRPALNGRIIAFRPGIGKRFFALQCLLSYQLQISSSSPR